MVTFVQKIFVFALVGGGLFAQPPIMTALLPRTSGMVGIVFGEAARLNVLNPGNGLPATGTTCFASLEFWDGEGKLLKSQTFNLAAGKSADLDLFSDTDLALTGIVRREIRGTISIPPVPATPTPTNVLSASCKLIGTLQILDESTGKTQVVLGVDHVITPAPTVITNP